MPNTAEIDRSLENCEEEQLTLSNFQLSPLLDDSGLVNGVRLKINEELTCLPNGGLLIDFVGPRDRHACAQFYEDVLISSEQPTTLSHYQLAMIHTAIIANEQGQAGVLKAVQRAEIGDQSSVEAFAALQTDLISSHEIPSPGVQRMSPETLDHILVKGLEHFSRIESKIGTESDSIVEVYREHHKTMVRRDAGYKSSEFEVNGVKIVTIDGPIPDTAFPREALLSLLKDPRIDGPTHEIIEKLPGADFFETRVIDSNKADQYDVVKSRCCFFVIDSNTLAIVIDGPVKCLGENDLSADSLAKLRGISKLSDKTTPTAWNMLMAILEQQIVVANQAQEKLDSIERPHLTKLKHVRYSGDEAVFDNAETLSSAYEYLERKLQTSSDQFELLEQRLNQTEQKASDGSSLGEQAAKLCKVCRKISDTAQHRKDRIDEAMRDGRAEILEAKQGFIAEYGEKLAVVGAIAIWPVICDKLVEMTGLEKGNANYIALGVVATALGVLFLDKKKRSRENIIGSSSESAK